VGASPGTGDATDSTSADSLNSIFERLLAPVDDGPEGAASLLGLEHEYSLLESGRPSDFRNLIHNLHIPGVRLDPGDLNAYRCPSGLVLTCDDAEAEIASPPVRLRPGFTRLISGWAAVGRSTLAGALPRGFEVRGFSTHLSAALPDALQEGVCREYGQRFGAATMLFLESAGSHGIYLRPRPGRLELCGEYAEGPRLGAAAALFAGGVIACAKACEAHSDDALPPALAIRARPATGRYGHFFGRRAAFGFDLYQQARRAALPLEAGGTLNAQDHVQMAWRAARASLGDIARPSDLVAADRIVSGTLPLGVEAGASQPQDASGEISPSSPIFGGVARPRSRPGLDISTVIATWPFTVFAFSGRGRTAYACIPRTSLATFLRRLDTERLDSLLTAYIEGPPAGRVLRQNAQTEHPGLWDEVERSPMLLPPERDAAGSRVAHGRSAKGRTGKPSAAPLTQQRRPGSQPTPSSPRGFPWPAAIGGGLLLLGLLVALFLANPFGHGATPVAATTTPTLTLTPSPSLTASPAVTSTPQPGETPPVEATSPAVVQTPRPTLVPCVSATGAPCTATAPPPGCGPSGTPNTCTPVPAVSATPGCDPATPAGCTPTPTASPTPPCGPAGSPNPCTPTPSVTTTPTCDQPGAPALCTPTPTVTPTPGCAPPGFPNACTPTPSVTPTPTCDQPGAPSPCTPTASPTPPLGCPPPGSPGACTPTPIMCPVGMICTPGGLGGPAP